MSYRTGGLAATVCKSFTKFLASRFFFGSEEQRNGSSETSFLIHLPGAPGVKPTPGAFDFAFLSFVARHLEHLPYLLGRR